MSIAATAEQAYTNYQQAEAERAALRSLLHVVGKADREEFQYGQSIYIVELDKATNEKIVSELQIYAYSPDCILARRLNGVRTRVSRQETIWNTEDAALDALEREKRYAKKKRKKP